MAVYMQAQWRWRTRPGSRHTWPISRRLAQRNVSRSTEHITALPASTASLQVFDEDAWDDLLNYIEERRVILIIGPDLLRVQTDSGLRPLYGWLAEKLAARLSVDVVGLARPLTLNDVMCCYLGQHGRREEAYTRLRSIMREVEFDPPQALRKLAQITDFDLFVTTTFDPLLENAINLERHGGATSVRMHVWTLLRAMVRRRQPNGTCRARSKTAGLQSAVKCRRAQPTRAGLLPSSRTPARAGSPARESQGLAMNGRKQVQRALGPKNSLVGRPNPLTDPTFAQAMLHLQRVSEYLKERFSSNSWHQARAARGPGYWLEMATAGPNILPGNPCP